jgi:hypothetical protein
MICWTSSKSPPHIINITPQFQMAQDIKTLSPILKSKPVRVFVRTTLRDLQLIDPSIRAADNEPSIEKADNEVIQQLCAHVFGSKSCGTIRHLATRLSDGGRNQRRGETRDGKHDGKRRHQENQDTLVDIIFDHNLSENTKQPEVMAYRYHGSSSPNFKILRSAYKTVVNRWIEEFSRMNLEYGLTFPRRPDNRNKSWNLRRMHLEKSMSAQIHSQPSTPKPFSSSSSQTPSPKSLSSKPSSSSSSKFSSSAMTAPLRTSSPSAPSSSSSSSPS